MRKLLLLGVALLGLFDSLYLLWSYTSPSRPMVCVGTGCDAVRASAYSHVMGMPMPIFGVLGYTVLAILMISEALLPADSARVARYLVAALSGFGFLVSLYLEYLQAFVIHAYCAWCVTSGVAMTVLAVLSLYDLAHPALPAEPAARLVQARQHFALCVAGLLVGVPAFYGLMGHGHLPPPPQTSSDTLAERLVRPNSHVTGNSQAAVTVVEFGDFECSNCAVAESAARNVRNQYGNRIRFVFRQFPLTRIHPFAERAAQASECAADQGKFWEAVDKIYAHQADLSDDGLKRDAAELGLDQTQFNQCLASGAAAARVQQDMADGKALGIDGTPTFFIGQKRIVGALPEAEFAQAIDQELASHGLSANASVAAIPASAPVATGPAAPAKTLSKSAASKAGTGPASPAAASSVGTGLLGTSPGGFFAGFQGAGAACSEADAAKKQPTLIGTPEVRQLLAGNPPPVFVDVRAPKDYAEGKIPGALNVPAGEVDRRWDSLPDNRVIILYESGRSSGDVCAASRAAGRALLEHGVPFERVKVYQDGLAGWEKAGLTAKN